MTFDPERYPAGITLATAKCEDGKTYQFSGYYRTADDTEWHWIEKEMKSKDGVATVHLTQDELRRMDINRLYLVEIVSRTDRDPRNEELPNIHWKLKRKKTWDTKKAFYGEVK